MASRNDLLTECALQLRSSTFDFEVLLGASVTSVWQALGRHVTRQLTQRRGVSLQQLGKFGFYKVQASLQPPAPVFLLADRFASTYGVVWRHRPPPAPLTATAEINMSTLGNDAGLGSDQTRRTLEAILTFIGKKLQDGDSSGRLTLQGVGSFTLDGKSLSFTFDASLLRTISQNDREEVPPPSAIFKKRSVETLRRKTMQLEAQRSQSKDEDAVLQRSMSLDGALQALTKVKQHGISVGSHTSLGGDDFAAVNHNHKDKKEGKEKKRHRHKHRQELSDSVPVDNSITEPVPLNGRQILPRFLIPEPRIPPAVLKPRSNHDRVVQAAFQREVANIEQAKRVDADFDDMMATRQRVVQIGDLQKRAEQSVARRELNDFLSNQIEEKRSRSRLKSASNDSNGYRDIKILPLEREISIETRRAEKQKLNQRLNEQVAAKTALKKDRRALDQAESAYFISKLKMQDEIDRVELAERKRTEKESLLTEWSQQKAIRAQKKTLKVHLRMCNGSTIQLAKTALNTCSIDVPVTRRMILRRLVPLLSLLFVITQCPQSSWAVDVGEAEDSASSCPNVTTVSIYGSSINSTKATTSSSSNVQITVASTCKSSAVKVSTSSEGITTLDLRSRSIAAVQSLPAVETVRLENNQIRAFTVATNVSAIYLANNSIPTLDDFEFPSGLTLLDLANNALGDIDNADLPSSLQYLNLSGNPIGSISNVSFPSSLLQLDLADSSVATLENFSFPGSVTTLNFSNNPITMIRGVIFPESLTALTLIASAGPATMTNTLTESVTTPEEARTLQGVGTDAAAQVVSVLEEFEVRQSDADMFEKVGHWDVSTTSTLSCSDSNANPRYVQDTMLCVLSDSEFATKYESVVIEASSGSTSGSMWGTDGSSSQAAERIALEESLHQRRSWFLIGAAALLSAFTILMFVNAFCLCLQRKIRGPSKENSTRRGPEKTASGRSNYFWHENESVEPDDEVHRLLSSDPSTITDENSIQPELEPAVTRAASAEKQENLSDPLALLTQELQRHEIHKSFIKHRELLISERESIDNGSGENSSPFVYFKAVYHRKTVVMKVLQVSKLNVVKRGSDVSSGLLHFVEEIRLSSELTHPQLVAFYGFVKMTKPRQAQATEDEGVALVMEYMDKCDLNTFIQRHKQLLHHKQTATQQPRRKIQERTNSLVKHVGWDDATHDDVISGDGSVDDYEEDVLQPEVSLTDDRGKWSWRISSDVYKSKLAIAIEVGQAVQYLHSFSPPLFHGNLSSRKVFLDSDWNVKLGDLTCCSALRRWSSSHKQHSTSSSTTGSAPRGSGRSTTSSQASGEEIHMDMSVWTAPEVLDGRQYTQKADIYSFGVLLTQLATYECSSAEHSVMDDTEVPMLNNAQKQHSADGEAPTPIRLLMFRCQAFQPEVRPTADELLQELQHIELELA